MLSRVIDLQSIRNHGGTSVDKQKMDHQGMGGGELQLVMLHLLLPIPAPLLQFSDRIENKLISFKSK